MDLVAGRHVVRLGHGLLRGQVLECGPDRCRVGLLATTALLLGGDVVELDVRVGAGARLDLFDVAATVAYHGRGRPATWRVGVRLAEAARLTYAAEPLVVSTGADVTRTLAVDLAPHAVASIRDTVVLGRFGEEGGRLRSSTLLRSDGVPVLVEDQDLAPGPLRSAPGMLGGRRVLDTVVRLGAGNGCDQGAAAGSTAVSYRLLDGAGTITRWLGHSLADSPLHGLDLRPGCTPERLVATL